MDSVGLRAGSTRCPFPLLHPAFVLIVRLTFRPTRSALTDFPEQVQHPSSSASAVLPFLRVAGLVDTGLASGVMYSIPLWSFPTIFGVKRLEKRDRLVRCLPSA